jgi:hypothetical protein
MNIDQWIAEQRSRFPDFDEESARRWRPIRSSPWDAWHRSPESGSGRWLSAPDQIQLLNLGAGINQQLMAINPKTGQPEPVKIDYGPLADSQSAPIAYYFGNDGPQSASLARAGGYSSGNDSAFGGLGDFLGNAGLASLGFGVGGVSGASAATGNGVTPQTIALDAAGLAGGYGLAGAGVGAPTAAAGDIGAFLPGSAGAELGAGTTAAGDIGAFLPGTAGGTPAATTAAGDVGALPAWCCGCQRCCGSHWSRCGRR